MNRRNISQYSAVTPIFTAILNEACHGRPVFIEFYKSAKASAGISGCRTILCDTPNRSSLAYPLA